MIKIRILVIHHLCEFQALTDYFLMCEWMVSDNYNVSDNSILTPRILEFGCILEIFRSLSLFFLTFALLLLLLPHLLSSLEDVADEVEGPPSGVLGGCPSG